MLLSNTSFSLHVTVVVNTTCTVTDPLPVTSKKVLNENPAGPSAWENGYNNCHKNFNGNNYN